MATFRILAIDGGGIRGIIPAVFLSKIAERLGTNRIDEKFDLIAGTSTGSLIASVAAMGADINSSIEFYKKLGPKIFPPGTTQRRPFKWMDALSFAPAYTEENLSDSLQRLFGLTGILNDAKTRLLITSYDVFHRQIYLMKSYEGEGPSIPFWEACKASCSAPSYFPAHILKSGGITRPLIDGGVFCNNPAMMAVAEAVRIKNKESIRELQQEDKIVLISLGTGNLMRKISAEDARTWGSLRWAKPIIDVLFDGASEVAHLTARQIVTNSNYVRLQVDLSEVNEDLDDASPDNIAALFDLANTYIQSEEVSQKIDHIINLLDEGS